MQSRPWQDESVLVTGAQGFIGSWLVERLLEEGADVVVTVRDMPAICRLRLVGLEERCDRVACDLLDVTDLMRILNEHAVTSVFHLAAQAIVMIANRSPLSTFESNIRGTYNLLEACRLAPTVERVVVASSDKAYGSHEDLPYREDFALQPSFPYDTSKACADLLARSYATTYQMPVAVTRLANVYGGGDFNFSRLVPDAVRSILLDEPPVVRSDGSPERDFIYVEDAVNAYLTIAAGLDEAQNHGEAFNVGAGKPLPVIDVVETLLGVSGSKHRPRIIGHGIPLGEIDRQYLDSTFVHERLGWEPTWSLKDGLAATYAWYEDAVATDLVSL